MRVFFGEPGGSIVFCNNCGTLAPAEGECASRSDGIHDFAGQQAGIYLCTNCGQRPGSAQPWCQLGWSHRWFRMTDSIV